MGRSRRGRAGHSEALQIADSPADLLVAWVAGGLPEPSCDLILEGNQCSYAMGATLAQVVLTGSGQRQPDALPPMPIADGEPIHVPSPPIPGGDQGPDYLPVPLGHQEGSRGIGDQTLDVIEAVGRARVLASSLRPQVQHSRHVGLPAST